MKKWFKECPFCKNEIKEKAIKCQYCWEFLSEDEKEETKKEKKDCPFCMNKVDLEATVCPFCDENLNNESNESSPKTSIKKQTIQSFEWSKMSALNTWKVLYRLCIIMFILLWAAFFWWMFELEFIDSEAFNTIDTLLGLTMLIITMVWCKKVYNHLLKKRNKNLHFISTWWPTRWWICPIACFFVPFQAVKDIYKTYNEKCWIIWWRRVCYLGNLILSLIIDEVPDESWFITISLGVFVVAEYILLFNIVKNINKSLEVE